MDSSDYQSLISNLAAETPGSIPGKITEALKDPQQVSKHFLEDTSAFLLQDKIKDGFVAVARSGGLMKKLGITEENVAKVTKAVKEGGQGIKKTAQDVLDSAKQKLKSAVESKGQQFRDNFTNANDELSEEIKTPARAAVPKYDPAEVQSRVLGGDLKEKELIKEADPTETKKPEEEKESTGDKVEEDLKKGEKDVEEDGEEDPEMSIPLAVGLGVASLVGSFLIKPKKEVMAARPMLNYSATIGA